MTSGEKKQVKKQVMLSYRITDSGSKHLGGDDTVIKVQKHLTHLGYSVFVGEEDSECGPDLSADIQQAIRDCSVFVAMCSPGYGESGCTKLELGMADSSKKKILPLWHSGTYPPQAVETMLATALQRVPRGAQSLADRPKDFEAVMKELVGCLEREGLYASPYLVPPAPGPDPWHAKPAAIKVPTSPKKGALKTAADGGGANSGPTSPSSSPYAVTTGTHRGRSTTTATASAATASAATASPGRRNPHGWSDSTHAASNSPGSSGRNGAAVVGAAPQRQGRNGGFAAGAAGDGGDGTGAHGRTVGTKTAASKTPPTKPVKDDKTKDGKEEVKEEEVKKEEVQTERMEKGEVEKEEVTEHEEQEEGEKEGGEQEQREAENLENEEAKEEEEHN